ncbi:hypothetical protein PCANC_13205 [Puccinia coronata f. sp. avenae]|uniref:Uncharacterized protein n=1 Tax=Puccinia coronata f. sp. avenae TaxID=200324 RepID=A0A2N5V0E8_9BASI|nr:hypothetical protein PCANC_13205 [Puccinia coronata f. sp. avenae]
MAVAPRLPHCTSSKPGLKVISPANQYRLVCRTSPNLQTTTTGEPGRPRETVTSSIPGAIGRANSDHPIGLRPLRNDARTRDPQKAHTSSLSRAEAATDRASRGNTYELAREPG